MDLPLPVCRPWVGTEAVSVLAPDTLFLLRQDGKPGESRSGGGIGSCLHERMLAGGWELAPGHHAVPDHVPRAVTVLARWPPSRARQLAVFLGVGFERTVDVVNPREAG
jgi:hypothetical protein